MAQNNQYQTINLSDGTLIAVSGTTVVSGTVNQGAPNAGGVNAWPISTGDANDYGLSNINHNVVSDINARTVMFDFDDGHWKASSTQRTGDGNAVSNSLAPLVVSLSMGRRGSSLYALHIDPIADGFVGYGQLVQIVGSAGLKWDPAGVRAGYPAYAIDREVAIFKTASATSSGSTALWTPTSSFKFRLMRLWLTVTGTSSQAVGGDFTVELLDGAGHIGLIFDLGVPNTAINGYPLFDTGWIDLGNGILSSAANNVLNLNLSSALLTGKVRAIVCGTEE